MLTSKNTSTWRPAIPRVEIVYMRKDVWLNLIDLHCHIGPRARQNQGRSGPEALALCDVDLLGASFIRLLCPDNLLARHSKLALRHAWAYVCKGRKRGGRIDSRLQFESLNRVHGGHMAGPRPRLPLSRFARLSIHQLQRTRASTLFSVSCGFVSEDFARQATNPSGRTSTAPVAVIP